MNIIYDAFDIGKAWFEVWKEKYLKQKYMLEKKKEKLFSWGAQRIEFRSGIL